MASKQLSLEEAIQRFVPDGASVAIGMALESLIPFAAGHELIRQRRRELELIVNGSGPELMERLRQHNPEALSTEALTLEEIFVATLKS